MSGDVQPRKRKDKKKKKDELSLEEPRGTAAALGEGDVFMHSYHDHGTGGHWCAKIIFFSLLAILLGLIGLIILENRGLSELEANAVESRYSGILEGWIEDAPDDDHHDEHTLDLKHHDEEDEEEDHYEAHEFDHDDDEHEDDDEHADEDAHDTDEDLADDEEDEDDPQAYKYYEADEDDEEKGDEDDGDEEDDDDDQFETEKQNEEDEDQNNYDDENEYEADESNDEDKIEQSNENDDDTEERDDEFEHDDDEVEEREDDDNDFDEESQTREDEDEHEDEDDEADDELEVEKIEREASEEDQEPISNELPALPEEDDDDDVKGDDDDDDGDEANEANDDDDDDFLEVDEPPPVVERITAPAGKPFVEVDEDEDSTEKPPATLEEEEEYEKQQEELRREEEQSSHIWLKLSVGAALLVATHAVVSRATAPRDEPEEERATREETPIDRRMTLIPEQVEPVVPKRFEERVKPVVEEIFKQGAPVVKSSLVENQDSEEEIEEIVEPEAEEVEDEEAEEPQEVKDDEKEELYSDEEVEEEEEEEEIEHVEEPKKVEPKHTEPPKPEPEPEPEPEDEVPDDVEIIDEEEIEEEVSDEEDISDVDDTDLLSRLEAKYGRLPEPERPGQQHKEGGKSVADEWPGEPADSYWRQQLHSAEEELRQGAWSSAMHRAGSPELKASARARYIVAVALDRLAEAQRDNRMLSRAIAAYLEVLKMNENLSDKKLLEIARRTLDRIQFRGTYLSAEPVYRLLIRRFPDEPGYRNNLTISFLMANRVDLAENVLKETINRWPDNRVALAHYAFVLKVNHNKFEEAVALFEKALEGDKGPACEPRFYYHYGDALLLLGRYKEAHEVHKRGAKHGHFLSPAQRSLYNVPRLKSKPWWDVKETPYVKLAENLERSWGEILKEGEAAKALYEKEKEGLKERGDWSQMDLFVRGQEIPGRCKRAPVTCSIVKAELAAGGCRRGQVKFSAMQAGTHVRPHVGPTNCRLRMHLGLSNTKDTYLRVDQEIRQWQEGKVLLFDDSFEHEVWHNGTGKRLVLIVDLWHPDLTPQERRTLPAI